MDAVCGSYAALPPAAPPPAPASEEEEGEEEGRAPPTEGGAEDEDDEDDGAFALADNAFCLTRPPGHHAGRFGATEDCCSNGFCLLNNVCAGIAHARVAWGVRRVAVIDLDVHFGNGTCEILRGDPDAFFGSVHLATRYCYPSARKLWTFRFT